MSEPLASDRRAAGDSLVAADARLEVTDLCAGYLRKPVLFNVSLALRPGEIVAVLGHNGAGKTTLLKTICGLLRAQSGHVVFDGVDITGRRSTENVRLGMSFMPAEVASFRALTVRENLLLGGFSVRDRATREARLAEVLRRFPLLGERFGQVARTMSGGQQRMLGIGMSLMTNPKLMLLDEPSLGLAPATTDEMLAQLREIAKHDRRSMILVEQNVRAALRIADRAYFVRNGEIILELDADAALSRGQWWDLF